MLLGILLPAMAQAADVTISQPWMRYLLPSLPASGYMMLRNIGDADAILIAAASSACGDGLMLHQSQEDSGTAMMMAVPKVTIPAHGTIAFSPGGYHLMCMQPHMKLGDQVPVTLKFRDGTTVAATMPVYGAQTAP